MKDDSEPLSTIEVFFREAVHESLHDRLGLRNMEDVENYMAGLLARFLHDEKIFAIRDAHGRRVRSVAEMLAEGDVRLNAASFEREREVHRHIGDFLLFWSGLFPEFLDSIRDHAADGLIDAVRQGSESYYIVSSFDYAPYDSEAPTFRKLSNEFLACREGLRLMRGSFEGFRRQGWKDGFEA
ncbi:MAG TPA: hypothetical protein PLX06_03155 [Fimbriimonadaceae bacterium]|nr:hypothetical protein [Fimbriimonadaceae bacterium]